MVDDAMLSMCTCHCSMLVGKHLPATMLLEHRLQKVGTDHMASQAGTRPYSLRGPLSCTWDMGTKIRLTRRLVLEDFGLKPEEEVQVDGTPRFFFLEHLYWHLRPIEPKPVVGVRPSRSGV